MKFLEMQWCKIEWIKSIEYIIQIIYGDEIIDLENDNLRTN